MDDRDHQGSQQHQTPTHFETSETHRKKLGRPDQHHHQGCQGEQRERVAYSNFYCCRPPYRTSPPYHCRRRPPP
ncbi:hypothetical protein FFLO_06429 [Filobasidium floriforme]|uniref:Uncharacterized protein n=1 Tax=Filobasidium floriforme TaxID=5210 RepID=A0A8K0JKJ6_9TREE|nr:hypothetical protein FFLO_06429 [Filobasidium floriforme]